MLLEKIETIVPIALVSQSRAADAAFFHLNPVFPFPRNLPACILSVEMLNDSLCTVRYATCFTLVQKNTMRHHKSNAQVEFQFRSRCLSVLATSRKKARRGQHTNRRSLFVECARGFHLAGFFRESSGKPWRYTQRQPQGRLYSRAKMPRERIVIIHEHFSSAPGR